MRQTCRDCPCNGGRSLSRTPQANAALVYAGAGAAGTGHPFRKPFFSGVGIDVVAQPSRWILYRLGLLLLRGTGRRAFGLRRLGPLLLLLLRALYRRDLGLHHLNLGLQQLGLLLQPCHYPRNFYLDPKSCWSSQ